MINTIFLSAAAKPRSSGTAEINSHDFDRLGSVIVPDALLIFTDRVHRGEAEIRPSRPAETDEAAQRELVPLPDFRPAP